MPNHTAVGRDVAGCSHAEARGGAQVREGGRERKVQYWSATRYMYNVFAFCMHLSLEINMFISNNKGV